MGAQLVHKVRLSWSVVKQQAICIDCKISDQHICKMSDNLSTIEFSQLLKDAVQPLDIMEGDVAVDDNNNQRFATPLSTEEFDNQSADVLHAPSHVQIQGTPLPISHSMLGWQVASRRQVLSDKPILL